MKINVLEYFIVLAHSSSISEAAQKLFIAQPSLTKALQLFEQEIGVKLFERNRSGIELTKEGNMILPQAEQMVGYYHEWLELGRKNALQSINVYIGQSFSDLCPPQILVRFRQKYDNIFVNYAINRDPGAFISRNIQNPVIAVFACDDQALQDCISLQGNRPIVLMRGEYRCLVSRNSPLACKQMILLQDLKDFFMLACGSSVGLEDTHNPRVDIIKDIVNGIGQSHIIQLETLPNVINQVAEDARWCRQ